MIGTELAGALKKSEKIAWQEAESVVYCSMKTKKIKARVNKDGLMGSKSRVHRVKKGKGSFQRRRKHQ